MSLYGSLTTAVSGLAAQSRALGHVADNVANSQTTGYKRVDTNFVSHVTASTGRSHLPGTVVARPDYANAAQGAIEQTDNPLALAIAGGGFFAVSVPSGTDAAGRPVFDDRTFYTRAGDFSLNSDGYLENGQGYHLRGWGVDPATGAVARTTVAPLRVENTVLAPEATSEVRLGANLPADAPVGTTVAARVDVYDALGRLRPVDLSYTLSAADVWDLTATAPGTATAPLTRQLRFGAAVSPAVAPGTLGYMGPPVGTAPAAMAGAADLAFPADFGGGAAQTVAFRLGTFGTSEGLAQFKGTEYAVRTLERDGVPPGSFLSLAIRENGDVAANYDNGQSRVLGRVPVVSFSDPDRLQRVDGQAFLRTPESGEARVSDSNANGAGQIEPGSVERSNVDIASEFTKLILAQRAYTANTRIVTTADELLQDTINMRR